MDIQCLLWGIVAVLRGPNIDMIQKSYILFDALEDAIITVSYVNIYLRHVDITVSIKDVNTNNNMQSHYQ